MAPEVLRDHLRERHRLAALPSSVDHRWGSPRLHVPRVAHVGKGRGGAGVGRLALHKINGSILP